MAAWRWPSSIRATPATSLLPRPASTGSTWRWSRRRRPNVASCCRRAGGLLSDPSPGQRAVDAWSRITKGMNRAEFCGGSNSCEDGAMTKRSRPFSPEVRERAVRMVLEHQGEHSSPYAAIRSIAAKIGCSGETLRNWVRQAERDRGVRAGPTTEEHERIKALERENRELRQANEILRKASAYFAMAELDRRSRT